MPDDANTYKVVVSGGRGGHIIYRETRGELQFWWEYVSSGVFVQIPDEAEWNQACTAQGAPWAAGRRDQVLKRVLEKLGGGEARSMDPESQADGILFRLRPRP